MFGTATFGEVPFGTQPGVAIGVPIIEEVTEETRTLVFVIELDTIFANPDTAGAVPVSEVDVDTAHLQIRSYDVTFRSVLVDTAHLQMQTYNVVLPGPAGLTIAESAVSGTNANGAAATSITLADYVHPGGHLVVFARYGGSDTLGNATATFGATSLLKLQGVISGLTNNTGATAYAFVSDGEIAADTQDITIDFAGVSGTRRGIMAFSVTGATSGVIDSGNDTAASDAQLAIPLATDIGDLSLLFLSWRNSAESVATQSGTTALEDDAPSRQEAHSETASGSPTTPPTATLTTGPDNQIAAVAVALN